MTATAWTAVVAPMLPVELVTGLLFEQITLTLTAIATVAVAAHAGR